MKLVDVLPEFVYKPLDLGDIKPETDLAPRADLTPVQTPPKLSIPVTDKNKLTPASVQQPVTESKLKGYQPLTTALRDSVIVNPDARKAILAQMVLERGWNAPKGFNYGNITKGEGWPGQTEVRPDTDANGKPITQNFRTYSSAKDFVNDYVSLLQKHYPDAYKELTSDDFDIDRFSNGLQGGKLKYATDPSYRSKIKRTYSEVGEI